MQVGCARWMRVWVYSRGHGGYIPRFRDMRIYPYARAFRYFRSSKSGAHRGNSPGRHPAGRNGPGFPAHAQAARGLKIGVDYVLTRARVTT